MLNLCITHGDEKSHKPGSLTVEKRYDVSKSLLDFKEKMYLLTGIEAAHQGIVLFESTDATERIGELKDDNGSLESQGVIRAGMRLHVVDRSGRPTMSDEALLASVPKYVMADEEYDKREGTYRAFKKQQALLNPPPAEKTVLDYPNVVVGARCLVESGHRGEVAFFGAIEGKPGVFVGVRLDDPFGLNDGCVGGKRLFEALPKCGMFLRPEKIQIGDFPPVDFDDEI